MKRVLLSIFVTLISTTSFASGKLTYLSCPKLDDRAPDLIVILDEQSSTASLQAPSSGSGLNFTSKAAFGPVEVSWRKDSQSLKQTYSIDRQSLVLNRKTFSEMSGSTHINSSACTVVKSNRKNKI
ncbi:TPA: hypothetical protein ACKP19_004989 [Serratia marcescens]